MRVASVVTVMDGEIVSVKHHNLLPFLDGQARGATIGVALPGAEGKAVDANLREAVESRDLRDGLFIVETLLQPLGRELSVLARVVGRIPALVTGNSDDHLSAVGGSSVRQYRYLIAQNEGVFQNVSGLPDVGGTIHAVMFVRQGDTVSKGQVLGRIAVDADTEAAARDRLFQSLGAVALNVLGADGTVVTQSGMYGHESADARRTVVESLDRIRFALANFWGKARLMPKSFLIGYTAAWTTNAMAQEIQAVALPVFIALVFDIPTAMLIKGWELAMRPVGAWLGNSLMKSISPVTVNYAASRILGAIGLSIVAAAVAVTLGLVPSWVLGAAFLLNATVQGLSYGITRGVAESILPRLLIGSYGPSKISWGQNWAFTWVELVCTATALALAVPMIHVLGAAGMALVAGLGLELSPLIDAGLHAKLIGGAGMMLVSSLGIMLGSLIAANLKMYEPWTRDPAIANGETSRRSWARALRDFFRPGKGEDRPLGLADYLPFAFFSHMHFELYGVLALLAAKTIFLVDAAAGSMIGYYDGGSMLLSFLATVNLLPMHKLGLSGLTALGAGVTLAFLWTLPLNVPLLTWVLAGAMGGMITITKNEWNSYYSSHLPLAQHRNLAKWMLTAGIYSTMPIFAAFFIARFYPALLSMGAILPVVAGAVTAVAAVMIALLLLQPPIKKK